jgi:hypothetical protein
MSYFYLDYVTVSQNTRHSKSYKHVELNKKIILLLLTIEQQSVTFSSTASQLRNICSEGVFAELQKTHFRTAQQGSLHVVRRSTGFMWKGKTSDVRFLSTETVEMVILRISLCERKGRTDLGTRKRYHWPLNENRIATVVGILRFQTNFHLE